MATRTVGIVGAGPAGIMAALEAARGGARVLLYDTNAMVGRKLLVTGNGRCNISNDGAAPASYRCADPGFLAAALARYGPRETLARLEELGILTYATPDGWRYPLSESAVTVAQALAAALELAGVEPYLQTQVTDLGRSEGQLHLVLGDPRQPVAVDRAVVATGGKAYPALGSRGAFFPVLGRLGHTIAPIFPALVPIMADIRTVHKLQGVRLDAGLKLYEGERLLGETFGNLLFTDVGLSGPAAMNLSHAVSTRPGATLTLSIDLLHAHRPALLALIARQRTQAVPMEVILGAVLPAKVPPVALELAGLGLDARLNVLNEGALARLLALLGDLRLRATGTRGFQHAQLSTGGVPVTEVAPETMASRIVPGLHLAGEVLDVVGPCGGYNLQFALTSGALAGQAAAC